MEKKRSLVETERRQEWRPEPWGWSLWSWTATLYEDGSESESDVRQIGAAVGCNP